MRTQQRALIGLYVAMIVLLGSIAYALVQLSNTAPASQLSRDERSTCLLQARALPATHVLTGAMYDLSVILSHIPKPKHKLSGWKRREFHAAIQLRRKARAYARIEHSLPQTRHC